jgi:hypothetical protein
MGCDGVGVGGQETYVLDLEDACQTGEIGDAGFEPVEC